MSNSNLPILYKKQLPEKVKKAIYKTAQVTGRTLAFALSTVALAASAAIFPPLVLPIGAIELYNAQKLLNTTYFKSFKDLAFIVAKKSGNMKIYQDVVRPDIFSELTRLDNRQKLGFLQLQALVRNVKI